MPKNSLLLATLLLLFGAIACTSENSEKKSESNSENVGIEVPTEEMTLQQAAVAPPFEKVRIPLVAHPVEADKGGHIYLDTGTEIIVPSNAFVDADGNPVKGKVDLQFREFHNAADLIISGVIMQEPKTGRSMETAGMFEMRGEQNGQAISIAPGKELEVRLASFAEGEHFNDYALNEETAEWKLLSENVPLVENESRKNKLRKLNKALPEEPVRPKERDIDAFVFDLEINYRAFPELRSLEGVIWEYAGKGENDPEKNPKVFEIDWKNIELKPSKKKGKYFLVLSTDSESFSTLVQPVMTGKNYDAALGGFEEKFSQYEKALAAQKAERERLENQSVLQRRMMVDNFGFRNCDIWRMPGRTKCLANFKIPSSSSYVKDVNEVTFFLVESSNRRVVTYDGHQTHRFSFDPESPSAIIAVLPNDEIAVFSREEFEKLPTQSFAPDKEEAFDLALHKAAISSPEDLNRVIEEVLAL